MNVHLDHIKKLLQDAALPEAEKQLLLKTILDADKDFEIANFKLDRTEKVKRTTAILLEETIEELEQKRKAVEAQNKELEIESALERVRAVALSMNNREDMLLVCRIITEQLELLNVKEIRNVQTAIFYEENGTYMNYEYYAKHDKTFITETAYTNHEIPKAFAAKMFKGRGETYFTIIEGKDKVKAWLAYQKGTNVFIDSFLETATSLNYYWFSLGPVALGISTYVGLKDDELSLFKRFLNVFELAYRRFLDIEKAEAQAKEARIETALERVRAVAMAMKKSEELLTVSEVMYNELVSLGFTNIRNAQIAIENEEKQSFVSYVHSDHEHVIAEAPYSSSALLLKAKQQLNTSGAFYQAEYTGKDLDDWRNWRNSRKFLPDERELSATSLRWYLYATGKGHMGISTFDAIVPEQIEILKRFKNVFELSYQRFDDLQKAEAQAREAAIQLALERVRARTMAMQHSDELTETSLVLFQQLKELGEPAEQFSIGVIKEEENIAEVSATVQGIKMLQTYRHEINDPYVLTPIFKAWKAKEKTLVIEQQWEELNAYNRFRNNMVQQDKFPVNLQPGDRRFLYVALFSKGSLALASNDPRPAETLELLQRFAKVFDQTYTRFLDLQKAEAQVREANIEAALEKVRSRSLAMHKSDELAAIARAMFEQLRSLGLQLEDGLIIMLFKEDSHDQLQWPVLESIDMGAAYHVPYFDHPVMNEVYEARAAGVKFIERHFNKEVKDDFLKKIFSITDYKVVPVEFQNKDFAGSCYHYSFAMEKYTGILLHSYNRDKYPEEHNDIIRRFTRVFEQAYVRFLDLQKAEAQAREANIEAALEKVRSRSLAMHKSEEIKEVVKMVVEKIGDLHIEMNGGVSIVTFVPDCKDLVHWIYIPGQFDEPFNAYLPFFEHVMCYDTNNAREKNLPVISKVYSGEEKSTYFNHIFTHSGFKDTPEDVKAWVLEQPYFGFSHAVQKHSGIFLNDYTGKLFSEETNDILVRFSKVFEQAYVRFLDLQKAEAQSREAQIQLALERARAQSMMMQHSTELDDTLRVFHEQVLLLNIPSAFSFLWLPDEKKDQHIFWAAWAESLSAGQAGNSTVLKSKAINYPLDRNEPATAQCLLDWKGSEPVVAYHVSPEGVADYFAAWSELISGVEQLKPSHFSDGLYYVEAFMKYGCFGVMVKNKLPEEEEKILVRFAIEFERTYTRFLDLQKAEAQAREAQIETGLERVRSRALAMHSTMELQDVIHTVHKELLKLNIAIHGGSFIAINNDIDTTLRCWGSGGTADTSEEVQLPLYEKPFCTDLINGIKKGRGFFTEEFSQQEKQDFFNFLFQYEPWSKLDAAQKKEILLSNGGYTRSCSVSQHTAIFIINHFGEKFSTVDNDILKRFGKTFEQAYTRFLDLQKAEAQAREARIEAALERVRSRSMAMHKSDELLDAAEILFVEMQRLDIESLTAGYVLIDKGEKNGLNYTPNPSTKKILPLPIIIPHNETTHLQHVVQNWKKGNPFFIVEMDEDETIKHQTFIAERSTNFPLSAAQLIAISPAKLFLHNFYFKEGYVLIVGGTKLSAEQTDIMLRFTKVFQQTYTRFLDLQKAEAQAREAQIEMALEKVRSRTMAMQRSAELSLTVKVLFEEFRSLQNEVHPNNNSRGFITTINEEKKYFELWITEIDGTEINKQFYIEFDEPTTGRSLYEAWLNKKPVLIVDLEGEKLDRWLNYLTATGFSIAPGILGTRRVNNFLFYSKGFIGITSSFPLSENNLLLLQRFAAVFDGTYTRFLDLQKAEAQAREAKIEAALEKVRSRTLAMHKSDELADTAAEVFHQLIGLGIDPNRLYIGIVNEVTKDMEMWATDEDGTGVGKKFTFNAGDNDSVKKLYDGWAAKVKSVAVDMQGKELEDYFAYLQSLQIPISHGLQQKRRVQSVAYFDKGFIGMASPDEQSIQNIQLLERFAAVFNLTFTRFNDLKIAEAHALQAEQDLIAITEAKQKAEKALVELQVTQKQLIQSEKMASLGELTAGIAHEIQNPLNFVNNFSEVSNELIDEMNAEIEKGDIEEAKAIANDIKQNLEKINHHGKRADAIVKGMLQHSRSSSATKEPTDINKLADEYLRLAYHGLRAKDKSFNATLKTDYEETLGSINVIPQDIGRVVLNLITNAFYVVSEKKNASTSSAGQSTYEPTVSLSTKKISDKVLIAVSDNGNGIPKNILDKIFQPFFTTKPTGQGTGLGLSLAYDIVKSHGGELKVETEQEKGTTFIIQLPVNS